MSRAQRGRRCQESLAPAASFTAAWARLIILCMLATSAVQADSRSGATYTVTIENLQFSPPTLTVHRGDHIVWANKDLFPHTVTATDKAFDSHSIAANASWTYLAQHSGTFAYSCTFHPTMKGTLVVQ